MSYSCSLRHPFSLAFLSYSSSNGKICDVYISECRRYNFQRFLLSFLLNVIEMDKQIKCRKNYYSVSKLCTITYDGFVVSSDTVRYLE